MSLPSEKSTSVEVNPYSFCRNRQETVDAILEYLRNDFGMRLVRRLGTGAYGDVVQLEYQNKSNVAGKIVLRDQRHIGEHKLWPRLQHPNLLPLLNFKLIRPIHAIVYLMPLHRTDIFTITSNIDFRYRKDALQLIKRWLKEILMGLSYLHNQNMCHLDLKSDNILLNYELEAIIADFSTLQSCEKPTNEYGVPVMYRPPEARRNAAGVMMKAEGKSFDSWCVGMIAFELFTGYALARRVQRATNWVEEVYAELYHALQFTNFANLVGRIMWSSDIDKRTIILMRNFVLMFLRIDPKLRPSAEEGMKHEFFDTAYSTMLPDAVWIQGVSKAKMTDLIEKYDKINTVRQDVENAETDYCNRNKHHQESKIPKKVPGFSGFRQERVVPITPLPNLLKDDHRLAATSRTLTSFEAAKHSSNVNGESEHKAKVSKEEMTDVSKKYDKINTVSQDIEHAKTDYSSINKRHLESKTPKHVPGFSGFRQERAAPITPLPNLLTDDHRLAATSRTLTSFESTKHSSNVNGVSEHKAKVSKEEITDLIEKYDKINTVSQDAENAKTDYCNSNKHHLESKTPKSIPGFSGFRQERAAPITPLPDLLQDDHRLAATSRTLTSFEVSKQSSNVNGESEHKVEATTRGKMTPLGKHDFILDLVKPDDTRGLENRYKGYNTDELQVMPLKKFNKQPKSSRKTSRGQAKQIAEITRTLPHPIEEEHQSTFASGQPTTSQSAQPSNGEPDPVAEATTARMRNPVLQQIRGWWEKKIARIRQRLTRRRGW